MKCGNFAVLVDLHVLPLGSKEDSSWFTADHIEDVTALVRDCLDQRVKQYTESLHNKRQFKQKKEQVPGSAFFVKGKDFNLVGSFLKRRFPLRCIAKQLFGDLRVFPERYVVCVSRPEDASAHHGNPSLAATELGEQSRSEYFSRVGETQEPFNSRAKTKKTVLQKIAKQASVHREYYGSRTGEQQIDQRAGPKSQTGELRTGDLESSQKENVFSSGQRALPETDSEMPFPCSLKGAGAQITTFQKQDLTLNQQTDNIPPDSINPNGASVVFFQYEISQESSKKCKPSDVGEDPDSPRAKRTCLGRPPATIQTHSTECSTETSKHDLLPLLPHSPVEANAESKGFPVSECTKTTLDIELLTLGKRAQRLPLTSNNTAQTNQNRLATSLRGLSVKPASSGSSITSRSTLTEEGSENVPRTSRLRRLKRS
ncbi:protein SLX4IP [Antennarius striatus]|uniref:protein SLX4IP n=1 Tax=Antennarius striatus TaxID=241820 RepID=UPI0035B03D6F